MDDKAGKASRAGLAPPTDTLTGVVDIDDVTEKDTENNNVEYDITSRTDTDGAGKAEKEKPSKIQATYTAVKMAWPRKRNEKKLPDGDSADISLAISADGPAPPPKPAMVPRRFLITDWSVRFPGRILALSFILTLVLSIIALAVYPPQIDFYETSDAFTIGNHPSKSAHRMAVSFYNTVQANNQNARMSAFDRRRQAVDRDGHLVGRVPVQMLLTYKAKNGNSVLTAKNLESIRQLENWLTSHATFKQLCLKSGGACQPITSAVPFYFQAPTGAYDGTGEVSSNIPLTTQRIILASTEAAHWYFEPWITASRPESHILRSAVLLGQQGDGQETYDKIQSFMRSIRNELRSFETDDMQVIWAQKDLLTYELHRALLHDAGLVIASMVIVFAFLWLLLSSFFLSFMGMAMIILAIGTGYFVYAVVFQVAYFGAVNLLVIFVCLGIAVDDVFVVVNAFKSTRDLFDGKGEGESMTEDEKLMYRLGTSYRKSASAVFLTSFTTAAAVLTNMLSPLKGVRTFVLFMAIIVMVTYVLTIFVYPSVVVIWARKYESQPSRLSNRLPDIQVKIRNWLAFRHTPFFLKTSLRRAMCLVGFLAMTIAGVVLSCNLNVNGGQLQILKSQQNYQRWIETRNFYGDVMTLTCQACFQVPYRLGEQQVSMQNAAAAAQSAPDTELLANTPWVPPTITTTTSAAPTGLDATTVGPPPDRPYNPVARPNVVADIAITTVAAQPQPTAQPAQPAAAQPASQPAAAQAASPIAEVQNAAQPAMAVNSPVPSTVAVAPAPVATFGAADCNTAAKAAAEAVVNICGADMFQQGKCSMQCAMALDTNQAAWRACVNTQTTVPQATAEKVTWAITNCKVESQKTLVKDSMLRVYLTWGLKGYTTAGGRSADDEKSLLPVFDPEFDFYNPSTQMDMLTVCNYIRNNRELAQDHSDALRCFVQELSEWLRSSGRPFPMTGTRSQQSEMVLDFMNGDPTWRTYVQWDVTPASGNVRRSTVAHIGAVNVLVWTPRKVGEDATSLFIYYRQWEDLMAQSNARSGARFHGFQSAKDWEVVITKMSTVNGIIWSISLSAMIAGLALLLFSQSVRVTAFGMFCLFSNTFMVLGLVKLLGWTIGMLEALSLSILLGLAVDYLLHVSEEYAHMVTGDHRLTDRYVATKFAVADIGVSVIYSAVTTCASVLMLVFAQFAMIQKMGLIIFFALVFSILISLIPFAAMLAQFGPINYNRSWRRFGYCLAFASLLTVLVTLGLYVAHAAGATLMGPTGQPMFS